MLKRFKDWLAKQAKANRQVSCDEGFNWAAGQLLRGRLPDSVDLECDGMPPRDFDEGAHAATNAWRNMQEPTVGLLLEARDELLWWINEHGCCAGHEGDLIDRIDTVIPELKD